MTPYYSLSDYLSMLSNGCSGDSALYLYMSPSVETLLKVICHKAAQIISRVKGWCIGRSIHFYGPVFSLSFPFELTFHILILSFSDFPIQTLNNCKKCKVFFFFFAVVHQDAFVKRYTNKTVRSSKLYVLKTFFLFYYKMSNTWESYLLAMITS